MGNDISKPVERFKFDDHGFSLNLGFFGLVGFNTFDCGNGSRVWGRTYAFVDLPGLAWAGWLSK